MALVIMNNGIRDGVLYLNLSGDVDLVSAPILKESIEKLYREQKCDFMLDLEQVSFIDSTGVGSLVSLNKAIKPENQIRLCNARTHVAKVFKITGLFELFFSKSKEDDLAE